MILPCSEHSDQDAVLVSHQVEGLFQTGYLENNVSLLSLMGTLQDQHIHRHWRKPSDLDMYVSTMLEMATSSLPR